VRDALEGDELDDEQRQVLEWRQIVGNTSPSKLKAAIDMAVDGLQYSGATQTHRWAGRGLQIQNFPRGSLSEDWTDEEMGLFVRKIKEDNVDQLIGAGLASDPIDAIKSSLRGMFVGDFAVCDYAQIEARVLPWLAGQDEVLEEFEKGTDLYVYTASQIYRKPMSEITKKERFIGKIATLALGFQGGAKAFIGMAEVYGVKDMDEEFAEEIKVKWREANSRITRFWYKLEGAAIDCVKFGDSTRFRKIHFKKEDEFLKMQLPSGKELFYYKPEIHDHPKFNRESLTFIKLLGPLDAPMKGSSFSGFGKKMGRVFTSGGRLVENATQSVARDVLADAMLRLPKENISFTVHDEIICEGIEQSELESIMLQAPTWAEGLPIGVDSWAGERYRK
jgi:DNA polymerase